MSEYYTSSADIAAARKVLASIEGPVLAVATPTAARWSPARRRDLPT